MRSITFQEKRDYFEEIFNPSRITIETPSRPQEMENVPPTANQALQFYDDFDSDFDDFDELPCNSTLTAYNTPRQRLSLSAPKHCSVEFTRSPSLRQQQSADDQTIKKPCSALQELIATEETYVRSMFKWIESYEHKLDSINCSEEEKLDLFGNIKEIASFHRDTLLLMFQRHQHSVAEICDEISTLIDENCFYPHFWYAMRRSRASLIMEANESLLKKIARELNDPMGINSTLLHLPTQRITRYPLLFNEILKGSFSTANKGDVVACNKALKKFEELLRNLNDATAISQIKNLPDLESMKDPSTKFLKTVKLNIDDGRGVYKGEVFIFDQCILYTEIHSEKKELLYRGCYEASKGVDLILRSRDFLMAHRRVQVCRFSGEKAYMGKCFDDIDNMLEKYKNEIRRRQIDSGIVINLPF